ncbi:glutamate receptor ionotropic, delta-2-like [Haliotis rufescens]|uniref:glutamate receptor ionotropic, delta-2-like n=1 Tax=Haliotis rufescens TaxID=6454 RepID=UPI00201F4445|nr:glutamate receptor ionotropic, delta-2-like [Haliotis rufescens]
MDGVRIAVVVVLLQFAEGSLIEIGVVSGNADAIQVITNNVTGHVGRVHWFEERRGSIFYKAAQISSMRTYNLDLIIAPHPLRGQLVEVISPGLVHEESWLDFYRNDPSSSPAYLSVPHLADHLHHANNVISRLLWTTTTIFSDRENRFDSHRLASELSRLGVKSKLVFVKTDRSNFKFLKHFMDIIGMDKIKHRLRFVLMCSLPLVKQILREAEDWDKYYGKGSLFRHFSQWLLLLPRSSLGAIEGMDLKLDHVAVISRSDRDFEVGQLSQWVVNTMVEVLSLNHMYNRSDATDTFLQIVRKEHDARTMNTMLHTLLWKPHGRKLSQVQRSRYDTSLNDVFPNLKLGLNQRELRTGGLEGIPFVKRHERNGKLTFTHASIDLLDHLKSVLNFTYSFTEPADGEWGLPVSGDLNNYTGLLGMLQREEIDLIANPMGYSGERDYVADFLPFVHESYNGMILRDTQGSSKLSSALTDPFRWQVYAVGGGTLLGVLLLYLAIEWSNPFYQDTTSVAKRLKPAGALDTAVYLFGSALHQGGVHLPVSSSGRILVSFWWLFIIVMTSAYSGNLIASLTVTRKTPPFSSLEDVFTDANLKIGLLGGVILHRTIETSNDSKLIGLWERIVASKDADNDIFNHNISVHMKKVMTENYAFLNDVFELEVYVKTLCDVYILKEQFLPQQYSLLLQQGSPLTDMFSKEILTVREIGLMEYWLRKWNPKLNDSACPSTEKGAKPIGLEKLAAALLALLVGVLFSGMCLLIELVVKAST